jgi:hypothetical protein
MSWADRLRRLTVGDPQRRVVEPLVAIHRRSAAQGERLASAAAQAPTAAAERELQALASEEGRLSAAVAGALSERNAVPIAVPVSSSNGVVARNHWGRLVASLEACQAARAQLLLDTPHLLELDPALVDLLRPMLRALDREVVALRAMIARADPQAID